MTGTGLGEVVAIPERRPRDDEQCESNLEEEGDDEQPFHERGLSVSLARE